MFELCNARDALLDALSNITGENITIYAINAALNYFDHKFVSRIMLSKEVCMQSSHSFVPAFSLFHIS